MDACSSAGGRWHARTAAARQRRRPESFTATGGRARYRGQPAARRHCGHATAEPGGGILRRGDHRGRSARLRARLGRYPWPGAWRDRSRCRDPATLAANRPRWTSLTGLAACLAGAAVAIARYAPLHVADAGAILLL